MIQTPCEHILSLPFFHWQIPECIICTLATGYKWLEVSVMTVKRFKETLRTPNGISAMNEEPFYVAIKNADP